MAAKIFAVGDVLPATTQLRISWADMTYKSNPSASVFPTPSYEDGNLKSNNNSFVFFTQSGHDYRLCGIKYFDSEYADFYPPYTDTSGDHPYMDIDTSNWSLEKRTISSYENSDSTYTYNFTWEDLNAPSGFNITFEENGGTTQTDLTEQTVLPTPLPTPTKSGYTFVNWYYDSAFTQIATAGDTIESNVTLYAKWELNTYTITYNSNGGSSIPQTSDATQLPSELPIPTKARNTFVGWYYDSTLKQKAKPNDMINTNITLYAKWYDSLSAFYTDIANLIREFENSGDNIKVTDFADRLRALLESV